MAHSKEDPFSIIASTSDRRYQAVAPPGASEPEPYLTPRVVTAEKAVGTDLKDDTNDFFKDFLSGIPSNLNTPVHDSSNLSKSKIPKPNLEKKVRIETVHYNPQYECTVFNVPDLESLYDVIMLSPSNS